MISGAGIYDRHAVEFVANNAHACVQWLIDQNVLFDIHVQPNGEASYHLTLEGVHSHRRILHAADAAGKEVETTLISRTQNHPNIQVLEHSNAVDLIISDNKIGLQEGSPGPRRLGLESQKQVGWNLSCEISGAGDRRRIKGLSIYH